MENIQSAPSTGPAAQERPEHKQTVDVTGLSEEAVRAVESLVSLLRGQKQPPVQGEVAAFRSHEEFAKALREWVESHPRRDTLADDSRESIYGDERDE
jgi:hypothetical protein